MARPVIELVRCRDVCVEELKSKRVEYTGYVDLQQHLSTSVSFRQYKQARAEFAQQNLGLVHLIVQRQFAGRAQRFGYEDLVQEGLFGVLRAIDLYNPEIAKFTTYASWWIRHCVQRAVENKLRIVRIPTYQIARVSKLKQQQRREGLDEDDTTYLRNMLLQMRCSVPGSEVFERRSVEYDLDAFQDLCRVGGRLKVLCERDLYIIRCRFGFVDDTPQTLQEISEVLGLSRERVRQLEEQALEKLRKVFE